ncbi:MAG: 2-C-methyl-D-erythritol 2,4-cyclodiphosphate synthase [Candidatus Hydrogenedentes bacterium]|nr:2-C-methyl-D-erythritol 2,4-cyclodiphosphate synthase [Candidatus Hydrogenedentota bacterium]
MRIGTGYDLHRLEAGLALVLGGVRISHAKGLSGHSDGDALAHAIIDALLGAAALGNIGRLFPDTDPQHEGADSLDLLARAGAHVMKNGYSIVNIDATIIAQEPTLDPHLDEMRENLARCLKISADRISVKAKTNEGLGPEGRGEAISVHAAALLEDA